MLLRRVNACEPLNPSIEQVPPATERLPDLRLAQGWTIIADVLLPTERGPALKGTIQLVEDIQVDISRALTYPSVCSIDKPCWCAPCEPSSPDCRIADEDPSGHPPL